MSHTAKQQFGDATSEQDAGQPSDVVDRRKAERRFLQHFGTVDLGHATGSDNESIDTDLAREHASAHEPD